MEEIIINKLCNFCMNKCSNCMSYEQNIQKDIIVYKCNNYVKNEKKITGYNGKWIDNSIADITQRNKRKGWII